MHNQNNQGVELVVQQSPTSLFFFFKTLFDRERAQAGGAAEGEGEAGS